MSLHIALGGPHREMITEPFPKAYLYLLDDKCKFWTSPEEWRHR
jgi:hypothetical protein